MAAGMFEYGVGGNEVKIDASEAIADIPFNRTLLVEKLTSDDPVHPEKVEGLTTIEDVFNHYKPAIDVEFEDEEGQDETFRFHSVADFLVKNMTQNSPFLSDLSAQQDFYTRMIKQLRSNKILQRALQNSESKAAFIEALQELLNPSCSPLPQKQEKKTKIQKFSGDFSCIKFITDL